MQYYGKQTQQALENFNFPYHTTHIELIYAITEIKKSAALANEKAQQLNSEITSAIAKACDDILAHKHDSQFVTCGLQGGAGTSINMNVNEVIAGLATEILKNEGIDKKTHPNDHVNMSQSTNDVNPSALKLTCLRLTEKLINTLSNLQQSFLYKANEFKGIAKLGRTHIQDAVPTTVGEELNSYASILKKNINRIEEAKNNLYEINLGGTAIGNSINASKKYISTVYEELNKITKLPIKKQSNLMSGTSSSADITQLSAAIYTTCTDLSKIAGDIRFLSSGPKGGVGEYILKPLQPGSSIMPGKVNPVMPETVNQLYYLISGYNITIYQATQGAHLQLGVMLPIIADTIISMLKLTTAVFKNFDEKCISVLKIDEENCRKNLENSTAYATLLTPVLGYDKVSQIVKEAIENKTSIRQIIIEKNILTEEEFNKIIT